MPKRMKIKNKKTKTFNRFFKEVKSAWMIFFMLGIVLILRSGLSIRAVLNPFRDELDLIPGTNSVTEIITTKKSSTFQGSSK